MKWEGDTDILIYRKKYINSPANFGFVITQKYTGRYVRLTLT